MYAMCGRLFAKPGKRDEFIQILLKAADLVGAIPECRMYLVSNDLQHENAIAVIEVWDTKEAHDASLQDENVQALIRSGLALMDNPPESSEMDVVGGYGFGI